MAPWRAAAVTLQHLDVLVASEERAIQNLEATLVRLGEEAVGLRLTVERLLSCLGKPCRLPPTTPLLEPAGSGASPTPPRLPAPSLPAVLRPHLRWIMRAIHLMREPTVLAWLLQMSSRTALGLAEEEVARLAEAASALFDPLNPGDERRQRAAVVALCELERLPHLSSPAAAAPDFAAVESAPWPSPLLRHLLAEHLCRLPSARRFLHRSLSGVLETFLDAIAAAEMDAGSSSDVDVSAAGEDGVGAGAGSALLSACERVLSALTNHAAALPSALLVICASLGVSSTAHAPLGGARHGASLGVSSTAHAPLGGARHGASRGGARNDASRGGARNDASRGGARHGASRGGARNDALHGGALNDASIGGARNDASLGGARHDASLGGAINDESFGVSTLAAELLILGWIAPAVCCSPRAPRQGGRMQVLTTAPRAPLPTGTRTAHVRT